MSRLAPAAAARTVAAAFAPVLSAQVSGAAVQFLGPVALAVVSFLLLTVGAGFWIGYAVGCAALALTAATHRWPVLGTDLAPRLLIAAGLLAAAAGRGQPRFALLFTGALLLGLLMAEPILRRLARPWYESAHLSAPPAPPAGFVTGGTAWGVNSAAVLLTGLAIGVTGSGWLLILPALLAAGVSGWVLADGALRWRTGHRKELARLTRALTGHQPRFLLYFSAPPGSAYQVRMWLPELDRLDEPYLVVLAERHNLPAVAAATGAPVIAYETFEALDAILEVPSLRAAFYVNNGMKNAHCVRYTGITHVQLYHGDSDKAVTASPLNQLYDRIFVAGQAAIDRFAAHGVMLPPERLRIVGRPQVAALAVARRPVAEADQPVVLYAPTWAGTHRDVNYCSLPVGETLVAGLLERGATVIFRPHPYSTRDRDSADALRRIEQLLAADSTRTGRPHRWGAAATTQTTLFACMDASDAMICDISSVASDYLYTGKPFAITNVRGLGEEEFTDRFPVARAAYLIDADAGNLPVVIHQLLQADLREPVRQKLRTYYLGDIPPEAYPEAFLRAAQECLATGPSRPRIH